MPIITFDDGSTIDTDTLTATEAPAENLPGAQQQPWQRFDYSQAAQNPAIGQPDTAMGGGTMNTPGANYLESSFSPDVRAFLSGLGMVKNWWDSAEGSPAAAALSEPGQIRNLADSASPSRVSEKPVVTTFWDSVQQKLNDVVNWTEKNKNTTAMLGAGAAAVLAGRKQDKTNQILRDHYERADAAAAAAAAATAEKQKNAATSGRNLNVKGLIAGMQFQDLYTPRRNRNMGVKGV